MTEKIYNTRLGRWLLLYLASASLWYMDISSLVVHATGGDIGSKDSPLVKEDFGGRSTGQITNPNDFDKVWNGSGDGGDGFGFAGFMFMIMGMTFTVGIVCAVAGLMANSAKISLAIQSGNASATQKHLKDHTKFYINTAIAAGSLFILQMIALVLGMRWVLGG